jgi:hypothetical protein
MSENPLPVCPECVEPVDAGYGRREFIRVIGERSLALGVAGTLGGSIAGAADESPKVAVKPAVREARPAEELVKELFSTLDGDQKKSLVLDWNHGAPPAGKPGVPTRMKMYNGPLGKALGDSYTKPQQELIDRILHAIANGEEGYMRLSRNKRWDGSGSLQGCGVTFFGEAVEGKKYCWLFTGHHLTIRCDGNSEESTAFGGPLYYGHSPNGYSDRNVFNYQTKAVLSVFDALTADQQKKAVVGGNPGEQAGSVVLKKAGHPGLSIGELTEPQKALVAAVMREVLSPYRKEDADEVMEIVKATGGMDKIHLAFYADKAMKDGEKWHFWRLEGPGFVWNYRVLPHVHTFVNVSNRVG